MPTITYRQALNDTLGEELARDQNVLLMGEEIGKFQGSYRITEGLLSEFGKKRVVDTPIAEEGFVGLAIGAAMLGLRPVVEIMTINFILVAIDQIVNHASKIHYMFGGQVRVPLVIRTPSGGVGQLAATHSQSFENWFAYCPGLKVVAPATPYDAKGLMKAAIRDDDPVIFIESLALYDTKGEVPQDEDYILPIGTAEVKREGTDITVVAYSRMTVIAMQVAQALEKEGVSVEVVDLRSLRPLDRKTIVESVKKTNRAVVIEEDWRSYGIGAEVAATIQEEAFDYLDAPVQRVAGVEVPLPYAAKLSQASKPGAQDLRNAIARALEGGKRWQK
jgi:pyruvate dehydrogenase E1 component beta subunit